LWISELKESPYGQAFAQSLNFSDGVLIALGTQKDVLKFRNLDWDEGLE
jgi:hypothetical protein